MRTEEKKTEGIGPKNIEASSSLTSLDNSFFAYAELHKLNFFANSKHPYGTAKHPILNLFKYTPLTKREY